MNLAVKKPTIYGICHPLMIPGNVRENSAKLVSCNVPQMFSCCTLSLQDRSKEGAGNFRRAPGVGCRQRGFCVQLLHLCRPEFPRGSGVSWGLRASHRTE